MTKEQILAAITQAVESHTVSDVDTGFVTTLKEQNEYMPLNITPKPETIIRVMMAYKGLSKPIDVKEQIFAPTPERKGFVAIEWGGTEMDDNTVY